VANHGAEEEEDPLAALLRERDERDERDRATRERVQREMAGRMDTGVRLNAALAQGLGVERGTDEARGGKEKCVEKWEGFGVNWDSSEDSD
jgi:hypothetical protein